MSLTPYLNQPVMLSSVDRMAFYLQVDPGRGRVDGVNSDTNEQRSVRRNLIDWATAISTSFESFCNRQFLIAERTEYYDVPPGGMTYFLRAVPLVDWVEVQNDPTGQFNGSQWTLVKGQDYYEAAEGGNLQIWTNVLTCGPRYLRVRYIGGMAYHPVNSLYMVTGVTGASNIVAGRYAYGTLSESIGLVVGYADDELEIQNISGLFLEGEPLTFQASMYGQDIPATGAVIDALTRPSLVAQCPDLDQALLIELRYMQKHQHDFENTSSGGQQGSTYRHTVGDMRPYNFQPETMGILNRYKRFLVGT